MADWKQVGRRAFLYFAVPGVAIAGLVTAINTIGALNTNNVRLAENINAVAEGRNQVDVEHGKRISALEGRVSGLGGAVSIPTPTPTQALIGSVLPPATTPTSPPATPTSTPQPTSTPTPAPTSAATPTPTPVQYAKPEINYVLPNTLYCTSENRAGNLAALTDGIASRATGYVGTTVQTLGDLVNRSSKVEASDTRNEVRLYTSDNPIKPAAVVSFSESGIDALISEVIQQKFNPVAFIDSGDYQSMLADQKAGRVFASTFVNITILDRRGQAFINHDPDAILKFLKEQVGNYGPAQVEFGRDGKTRFRYEGSLDGVPFHTVNSTPEQQRKTFDAAFK